MDDLRFLNQLVEAIEPDLEQTESARQSLLDHIDASQMRRDIRSLVDPIPDDTIPIPQWSDPTQAPAWRGAAARIAVAASVIVIAAVAAVNIFNAPAANATLENLARAVERLPDEALTEDAVERRVHSESLAIEPVDIENPELGLVGVVVSTTETRQHSAADGIIRIQRTYNSANFIVPVDAAAQGEIEDRIGIGTTETVTVAPRDLGVDPHLLSSNAETLRQHLLSSIAADGDPSTPMSTQILDEIIALHKAFVLTPLERAATLEVLATVNDLTVSTDGAVVTVVAEYASDTGRELLTAVFDQSGWLIAESLRFLDGIPGVTSQPITEYKAQFTPPDFGS